MFGLSGQELARAQGFPDDFDWGSLSKNQIGQALGNAWPLPVSSAIVKDPQPTSRVCFFNHFVFFSRRAKEIAKTMKWADN